MATIRTSQQRRSVTRRIPVRRSSKLQTDLQKKSLTFSEMRKQDKSERELFKRIEDVSQSFLKQATNINELQRLRDGFVRQNMSRIPEQYQDKLKEISTKEAQKIIDNQKKLTSDLRKDIEKWKKDEDRFDERGDKEDDAKRKARFKAKEKYYDTLSDEAQKIINQRLAKGDIIDRNKLYSFLKDKANFEKDKREAREERKIAEVKAKEKELEIREYFERPNVMSAPPSVSQIQKDLKVDTYTARQIQDVAKQSAKQQVDFVNKLKNTIEDGARYDINSLKEAGLSGSEAREILEKQDRNDQKIISKLPDFSKQIQNKLDTIKFETQINPFLLKIGKSPQADLGQSFLPKDVKEVNAFRNLNPREQNVVLTYTGLRNIKDNTKDVQRNLPDLKQLQAFSNLPTPVVAQFNLPKELLQRKDFKFDMNTIKNIANLSENALKKLSINYESDKVSKIIKDYNTYSDAVTLSKEFEKKLSADRIKNVIRAFEREINKTIKAPWESLWNKLVADEFKTKERKVGQTFIGLIYANEIKKLQRKLNRGEGLSRKDYTDYLKRAGDFIGLKRRTREGVKNYINNFKTRKEKLEAHTNLVNLAKNSIALAGATTDTVRNTLQTLIDWSEITLNSALSSISKTPSSIANLGKNSLKFLFNTGKDLVDVTDNIAKRWNTKQKSQLKTRTGKEWSKVYSAGISAKDLAVEVFKNPKLLVLALTTLGVISSELLSKALKNLNDDPFTGTSKVAQYLIERKVLSGAIKGAGLTAQQIKAKLSPFVLRNVQVFEDSPTKITTARALLELQGKKVDLYSATPDKINKLLKGSSLSKNEINFLIKDMLKNPDKYIDANKKIRTLETIIRTKPQQEIANFIKNKDVFISGSASLKVQLKNFRKIGDFDLVVSNPKSFANLLANHLNKNTILGKISKIKRFKLVPNQKVKGVYAIFDRVTRKKIADIDDLKLVNANFRTILGRALSNKDFLKINGIKFLKVETQLPAKLALSTKTSASFRSAKELKDVAKIVKGSKNKLSKTRWKQLKNILDNNDNVLKVRGDIGGLGKDRKYFWASKYGINTNKSEKQIISSLRRLGFTQADINKNIDLYSQDGFYFGINKIYSYFLKGKKGTAVVVRDLKLGTYPKSIRELLKKNIAGQLNASQKLILRKKLNRFIKNNPDKVFPGEKALTDLVGEEEAIAGVFTRLFPKKAFIKREIYVPSLNTFIGVQEATLGRKPVAVKGLYQALKNKFKKGYSIKQMKKDIINWAKKNIKGFKDRFRRIDTSKDKAKLNQLRKTIDDQISSIKKSKLKTSDKRRLVSELQRKRKLITPRKARDLILTPNLVRTVTRTIRQTLRKLKVRVPKTTLRKVKRVVTKARARPSKITRVRKVVKPRIRKPITRQKLRVTPRDVRVERTGERILRLPKTPSRVARTEKIPKRIKIKPQWDSRLPKGYERLVNVLVRVRGTNKELNLRTTPNRALNYITRLVDNTTARSFKLKSVGITKNKDVKAETITQKFRPKRKRNSVILDFVEKSRFAIDTKGEKRGLKISKVIKTRKPTTRKKTTKKRKTKR